jgi:soluble lytic murein transglycosylase-like protein
MAWRIFGRWIWVPTLFLAAVAVGSGLADAYGTTSGVRKPPKVSPLAKQEIPDRYLTLYQRAGRRYDVPWTVLAGIGKVESDHGRSRLPGVRSGANHAGACGPMQIGCVPGSKAGNSWARYGHGRPYDPANAIPAAARYLVGHGAHANLDQAIYGYNHAGWYVAKVKAWAHRYRTGRL